MNRINIIPFLAIVSLLLIGCEKELKVDQTKIKPKIVVNGVVNVDDGFVSIHLSESRDMLFEGEFPSIKDATVKFYENGTLIGELDEDEGYYTMDHNVVSGKIYKIEVEHDDFDNVEATTTAPYPANTQNVQLKRLDDLRVNIDIQLQDNLGKEGYYGLEVTRSDTLKDTTGLNIYTSPDYPYDPYIFIMDYYCSNEDFVDYPEYDAFAGQNCSQRFFFTNETFLSSSRTFSAYSTVYFQPYETEKLNTIIDIQLNSYSEDYYRYLISKELFYYTSGPFSEPVRIYTNVENGLGVFGGVYRGFDHYLIE